MRCAFYFALAFLILGLTSVAEADDVASTVAPKDASGVSSPASPGGPAPSANVSATNTTTTPSAAPSAPPPTGKASKAPKPPKAPKNSRPGASPSAPKQVDITADQTLEWYQDQQIYVARGNARAIRGDMIVDADVLTAHERDKPKGPDGKPLKQIGPKVKPQNGDESSGDIDIMTAEGHVRITDPRQRVTGDHAVYDLDKHVAVVTGQNLKYETEKETVTARDSMEYWEDKKIAVARGNAVGIQPNRRVEGDVLTAEFRDDPNGTSELWKMTAEGHVTVITKADVSRGDHAVYDVSRNIAILRGNVRITRADGTQISGDVGEVDFNTNQSRVMNDGTHRVHALLASKTTDKSTNAKNGQRPAPGTAAPASKADQDTTTP